MVCKVTQKSPFRKRPALHPLGIGELQTPVPDTSGRWFAATVHQTKKHGFSLKASAMGMYGDCHGGSKKLPPPWQFFASAVAKSHIRRKGSRTASSGRLTYHDSFRGKNRWRHPQNNKLGLPNDALLHVFLVTLHFRTATT